MAQESNAAAKVTPDLFTQKLKRGRPAKVGSLSNAERQAAFRARRIQVDLGETMAATVKAMASEFDLTVVEVVKEMVRFALMNRNWRQTGF